MAKEYIEREAVLAEYDRQHKGPAGGARRIIAEFPAADVVEVVKCKDCVHWGRTQNNPMLGSCDCDALIRHIGFFCANGERKSEQ